jgi:sulfopyruvate decarboxylase subunit beta
MTMRRDEALRVLARHVTDDDIVVAVYTTAFDWIAIRNSPLNYIMTGAMGLGSSHALGLALGRPDKRVLVLDGDGSLLMNLGTLVTVAEVAPRNLIHFVFENGTYEANGSHRTPAHGHVDFSGLAAAAGYRSCHTFDDLAVLANDIGAVACEPGPVFVTMKVEPGVSPKFDYDYMHGSHVRNAFKAALANAPV